MPNLIFFGANSISLKAAIFAQKQGFECVIMSDNKQVESVAESKGQVEVVAAKKPHDLPIEKWLAKNDGTLAISIGAPWFFDHEFLEKKMGGIVLNLHGTHLPRSRGGNLFSWQILSGQRTGMCLLHKMTEALDAGAIIDFEEFIYPASCRKPVDFIKFYEEKNIIFLQSFLLRWRQNEVKTPIAAQPEYLSTYWPRLRADIHGWLDWNWSPTELERFICAFDEPYSGARCRWRGQEIIIRDAWSQSVDGNTHPFQWGLVTRNNGQWLNVAAKGGELLLCSINNEDGGNLLDEIRVGDRLFSSPADIEKAMQRVLKTEAGLELQKNLKQKGDAE